MVTTLKVKAVTKKEGYKADKPVTTNTPAQPSGKSIWDITNPSYVYVFGFPLEQLKDILSETQGKNSNLTTYLGLLDEWSSKEPYDNLFIIEVDASNVIRPCRNNSPELKNCPCKDPQTDKKEYLEYLNWWDNFFNNSIKSKIPFTGMGYTYNWAKTRKKQGKKFVPTIEVVGASEYIIKPGSEIKVLKRVKFTENLTADDVNNIIKV